MSAGFILLRPALEAGAAERATAAAAVRRARGLAQWLDNRVRISGAQWRPGLDAALGLIAGGGGDAVAKALAS